MTRWLVTGAGGQLGTHLLRLLGPSAVGLPRASLDLTCAASVTDALSRLRPSVVINAAVYTAVDDAETHSSEAFAVNATAVSTLASACASVGARLIHVSTDYVFDGRATRPYETTDAPNPLTAYGRTKLAGEQAALAAGATVVRTAWVYGGPGRNFVDTMLSLAESRPTVDVVADQVGSPTWVADLAAALVAVPAGAGLVHFVNSGTASWYEFARSIFEFAGHDPARVRPTTSATFPRPAPRPAWSVLSTASWTALGLPEPRPWQDALRDCIAELNPSGAG
jgi:dTDP-4-dehydrorhamnose reductase